MNREQAIKAADFVDVKGAEFAAAWEMSGISARRKVTAFMENPTEETWNAAYQAAYAHKALHESHGVQMAICDEMIRQATAVAAATERGE